MGIAVFFVLGLIAAAIIAYPLLPGRTPQAAAPSITDGDIERAVAAMRRGRKGEGHVCPSCGKAYQPGDQFCVRCGGTLPQAVSAGPACPSCGRAIHDGDQFCAKCGYTLETGEGM